MSEPRLAVVIVSHDSREDTLRLLDSLAEDPDYPGWEVVVVDNESSDGTLAAVRDARPEVRTVRNEPQRGFAAGLNQGAALTTAPAILTVNPDSTVPSGTAGRLLAELDSDRRVAAAGPLIRFPDGSVQRHGMFRPRPATALVVLTGLGRIPPFRGEAERYYGPHRPGPPLDVEQLTGACLLMRREALEQTGGFDEEFFLYCEDVDWCLRAHEAGWRLRFVPEASVIHRKSAAARARGAWAVREYYKSLRRFYDKHSGKSRAARAFWHAALALQERAALWRDRLSGSGVRY